MQTKHRFLRRRPRRAAVVAQVAVCSTVLIGLCALVLDIGQMHLARTELQRSADAAALAGASAYAADEGLIQSETLGALAYQRALQFSRSNLTLGAPTFAAPADVVAGTLNWQNPQAALDTSGADRFNAVQVVVRRTADSANGSVVFNFAKILGFTQGDVTAWATAAFDDRFGGYRVSEECNLVLPFTIYRDTYNEQLQNGPDQFYYDHSAAQVHDGTDNVGEVHLYPYKLSGGGDGAGNFGILNIGTGNQGSTFVEQQILNGVSPADLETEIGTSDLTFVAPDGQPIAYNITGSPGLKVTMEDSVIARMGDIVGFFLHDAVTLDGQNAIYHIVDMRFGRIMHIDLTGAPKTKRLVIQPVAYTGPGIVVHDYAPSSRGQVGALRIVR